MLVRGLQGFAEVSEEVTEHKRREKFKIMKKKKKYSGNKYRIIKIKKHLRTRGVSLYTNTHYIVIFSFFFLLFKFEYTSICYGEVVIV